MELKTPDKIAADGLVRFRHWPVHKMYCSVFTPVDVVQNLLGRVKLDGNNSVLRPLIWYRLIVDCQQTE
jgi:hypothetical protein